MRNAIVPLFFRFIKEVSSAWDECENELGRFLGTDTTEETN